MVKTLLKSALREIRQSLGRYLAILAIVFLGVGFFAGLRTCQPSMAATGIRYLAEQRLFDFRLLSTLGFTKEDVACFAGLEGIGEARGAVYADFLTEVDEGEELVIKAHSLTEGVNVPQLLAGRMPEAAGECLADLRCFGEEDLGRTLTVSPNNDEDTRELLHCGEYTIVGLVHSPYYLNFERGTSSIGSGSVSGYIYIPEDGFDFEAYYEIFLTMEDPADAYSDAYQAQIDALTPGIEAAVDERADLRYDTIYADAMKEIQDAEVELADGWDEYRSERADAEQELDDAHRELDDGEAEYADGVKDYEQGRADYADGLQEYEDGQREAADAEQEIADAEKELADAEQEIADAEKELADARQELDDGWADYEQGRMDAQKELDDAHQKLLDGEKEYADGEIEYADGLRQLEDGQRELDDAQQQLRDGERELLEGEREFLEGEREFLDGKRELEDGERELAEAKTQLEDAKKQLQEAEAQLEDAKKQLEEGEASYGQVQQLYTSTEQLAQGVGAAMGMPLDAGALIQYLASGAIPELNAAVDAALQGSGSSAAALTAGWQAAESQLGAPLSAETIAGLRATLDQGRAEYASGAAEYESGRAEYEAGLAEYEAGEQEIISARQQLEEGRVELEKGRRELEEGRRELEEGRAELEKGRRELEDARQELEDGRRELDDARQELDDGWQEYYDGEKEAQEELAKAYRELADGEQEYADGLREYEDGVKEFQDGQQELADGRQELADAWEKLADARRKLADAKDELAKAPGELADARQELDDGWQEYSDGRAEADAEFADAEAELTDAEQKLADAYEDLRALKHATTYTLTRSENVGYACFENDTSIIEAISVVFPVFFFLVAALVCMTTMTRMVDEQRTQIGVLKALGYSNGQIMSKYLFYSGSAALAGSISGFFAGSYALPWVIWEIYGIIYGFSPLHHVFLPGLMLVSFAAALLCSMGATYLSCRLELKRQAAELLRPKTPRAGRRVFLEYITPLWRRLSFLHKVSVRNVLRYQSRLIMMVLGIGGCTALLVTGFGIRDSIQHVADYQFDEIQLYDYTVAFQDPQTEQSAAAYLTASGWAEEDGKLIHSGSIDVLHGGVSKSVFLVIPADGQLDRFVSLHSGGEALPCPGVDEVVINIGLAENMGISLGEVIQLRDEDYGTLEVTVSGIADNYVQNYIYLSPETYRKQYDEEPEYNGLYVLGHEGADPYEEGALLLEDDGVSNVAINQATRDQVDSMLSRLDYIVIVVVACAGALAFIVLYNLTNINITERVREIATIKVLGFYRNEVASYVFREINMLSVLGSLAGLLMGKALHAFVMAQIQIDAMYFSSRITALSYAAALCVTMLFTLGISFGMRPRLHKIDMAESLKSIE